jgi:hypothetical protein
MRIAVVLAESGAAGCYGNAARSWSNGTNISMIAAGCAGFICGGGKTFSSGWWCTSGAANLGLLMRTLFGKGTPRGLQGRLSKLFSATERWGCVLTTWVSLVRKFGVAVASNTDHSNRLDRRMKTAGFTSRC